MSDRIFFYAILALNLPFLEVQISPFLTYLGVITIYTNPRSFIESYQYIILIF